jgi:hypothetical protein
LKRGPDETRINDYNSTILQIWGANIDIQFIKEKSCFLNYYITTYMTKAEKNACAEIWDACNESKSLQGALKSYALQSLKKREAGALEVADKLLGFSLYECSVNVMFLKVYKKNKRTRRLKELKDINKLNGESDNIFCPNMIDNYYPNRPESLKEICLYDFVSWYDFKTKTCDKALKSHSDCKILKSGLGFIHKRKNFQVVRVPKIIVNNRATREQYYHNILMMFQPWTDEEQLLNGVGTYFESFHISIAENSVNNKLYTEFQDERTRIEEAKKMCKELLEEDDSDDDSNEEDDLEENPLGAFDLANEEVDENHLNQLINSLNKGQRYFFDLVMNKLEQKTTIRHFCSGVAGTGKSFLIKAICDQVRLKYKKLDDPSWTVVIVAYTGLAAYNINGITIHRFFKLPVSHGKDQLFWNLNASDIKSLRMMTSNLKLIIAGNYSFKFS